MTAVSSGTSAEPLARQEAEGCQTSSDAAGLTPGVTVFVRDEEWLVTSVTRSTDGWMITARGLSDYVRDHTATFYTALDSIEVFNPAKVKVVPDTTNQ